ncbi:hypothetical protein BFP72_00140 [Reichenbachiella sp. 5M10]|uniref:hypothetical protein n=1 Tax=Reichenbachiella sp. 5M10 TaxID=1889772 RepID=UPI000C147B11|nr:hypothetical protein [Reichenbachiella sp. 5M10]PIB33952.1 hypothetical protein BFP72_00140 [Reichenbachiella sp. 5M10]
MVWTVLIGFSAQSQRLEDVVDRHFTAVGEDVLNTMRSVEVEMVERIETSGERVYVITKKRPNKVRKQIEVRGYDYIAVFDGDAGQVMEGWSTDSIRDLTIKEQALLEIESAIGSPLSLAWLPDHRLEWIDEVMLAGLRYAQVRMYFESGYYVDFFIDQTTYYLYKYVVYGDLNEEVDYEYFYSNFKRLGGFVLPYSFEKRKRGERTVYYTIRDMVFGGGVAESMFRLTEKD